MPVKQGRLGYPKVLRRQVDAHCLVSHRCQGQAQGLGLIFVPIIPLSAVPLLHFLRFLARPSAARRFAHCLFFARDDRRL